jgi:hypothetical protein
MKKLILTCSVLAIFAMTTMCVVAQSEVQPFNGKNLNGWKAVDPNSRNFWTVSHGTAGVASDNPQALVCLPFPDGDSDGVLINLSGPNWGQDGNQRGVDLRTEQEFGDCIVEIEFMVAKGSNSGVYLMGEYELQVADGWGAQGRLGQGHVGAIYSAAAPKVNASQEPGKWQKYVIDFVAPRFDADGKKTANAKFVEVTLNGQVVQENVEVPGGSTGGGVTGQEHAKGPLMLQGNHGPVAYRNIVIQEK